MVAALFLSGCAQGTKPEDVALEYARALYASDLARAYRLISAEDRRVKDEAAFRREGGAISGFALEVSRRLASAIEAAAVETKIAGDRATVTLKVRLPDANARELAALAHDWDEKRLNALPWAERERITRRLDQLRRSGQLPMLEGQETFEMIREEAGWRVSLNWAGGVRVQFFAAAPKVSALDLRIEPPEAIVAPGERFQVVLRAENRSTREIVARVHHQIAPEREAGALALLHCPLFIPVRLGPGKVEEFRSEYLLLKDVPADAKQFRVTYEFAPVK